MLRHAPGHDSSRIERGAGLARIDVLASIFRGERAWDYAKTADLRQAVGQRLGNAVAQIIGVRRTARVDERQHRDRVNRPVRRRTTGPAPPSGDAEHDHDSRRGDRQCFRVAARHAWRR